MYVQDLDFSYPDDLVAQFPQRPTRVLWNEQGHSSEIDIAELIRRIPAGDVLVINDSKVLPRRIFSAEDLEILFIQETAHNEWEVLFPARQLKKGHDLHLPDGVTAQLLESGLPQKIGVSQKLTSEYFEIHGELPLPPYIQKARGARHQNEDDKTKYQTAWAEKPGSLASPTASLHFSNVDLQTLKQKGVQVVHVTLHVGLGTFLPIKTENLDEHQMHAEYVEIPASTWQTIARAKNENHKVWALGTTVARTLESAQAGLLTQTGDRFSGATRLFIQPGFQFQVVDRLLTNFHQPKSTLLALVAAFAGLENVKRAYAWAIERKMRLFSYGDLSAWL